MGKPAGGSRARPGAGQGLGCPRRGLQGSQPCGSTGVQGAALAGSQDWTGHPLRTHRTPRARGTVHASAHGQDAARLRALVMGRAGTWLLADAKHEVVKAVFRQLLTSPPSVCAGPWRKLAAASFGFCCL